MRSNIVKQLKTEQKFISCLHIITALMLVTEVPQLLHLISFLYLMSSIALFLWYSVDCVDDLRSTCTRMH